MGHALHATCAAATGAAAILLSTAALTGCAAERQQAASHPITAPEQRKEDLLSDRVFLVREGERGEVRYSIIGPDGRVAHPITPADELMQFQPNVVWDLNRAIVDKPRWPIMNPEPLLMR